MKLEEGQKSYAAFTAANSSIKRDREKRANGERKKSR
jgi:hypothetical protein